MVPPRVKTNHASDRVLSSYDLLCTGFIFLVLLTKRRVNANSSSAFSWPFRCSLSNLQQPRSHSRAKSMWSPA